MFSGTPNTSLKLRKLLVMSIYDIEDVKWILFTLASVVTPKYLVDDSGCF